MTILWLFILAAAAIAVYAWFRWPAHILPSRDTDMRKRFLKYFGQQLEILEDQVKILDSGKRFTSRDEYWIEYSINMLYSMARLDISWSFSDYELEHSREARLNASRALLELRPHVDDMALKARLTELGEHLATCISATMRWEESKKSTV